MRVCIARAGNAGEMKYLVLYAALTLIAATTYPAAAAVSSNDADFVQTAQHEALGEYALASLAKNKAQDPAAKALAQKVLANAGQVNTFIKTFASSHAVPTDNKPSVRADEQYGNISSASGKSFDQAFANVVRIDVNIAIDTYQDEAHNGADATLRNFAKQQVAVLQQIVTASDKLSH